ncbi:MAG: SAF domain-containing protein [Marmoricola sp.]
MKRKIAITSAIVLALLGAVMVVLYTRGADGRALASSTPETVWTAVQAVPAGTPLEEARKKGLIRETMVPSKARPAGALEEISSTNASLVATSDIAPGEYLLAARFADTRLARAQSPCPKGWSASHCNSVTPARWAASSRQAAMSRSTTLLRRRAIEISRAPLCS